MRFWTLKIDEVDKQMKKRHVLMYIVQLAYLGKFGVPSFAKYEHLYDNQLRVSSCDFDFEVRGGNSIKTKKKTFIILLSLSTTGLVEIKVKYPMCCE